MGVGRTLSHNRRHMHLEEEAKIVFWFITDVEYSIGVASLADLHEREEVFEWLDPGAGGRRPDPRGQKHSADESQRPNEPDEPQAPPPPESSADSVSGDREEDEPLQLLPLGLRNRWCFTKNDVDFYPSVPHGHLNDKTNPWPKLSPYTGRAYSAKDHEDTKLRLSRQEMITLWNNKQFRRHALETIAWYSETFPQYHFPVANPRRLPRWRRR